MSHLKFLPQFCTHWAPLFIFLNTATYCVFPCLALRRDKQLDGSMPSGSLECRGQALSLPWHDLVFGGFALVFGGTT
jgi:hypothetical protein